MECRRLGLDVGREVGRRGRRKGPGREEWLREKARLGLGIVGDELWKGKFEEQVMLLMWLGLRMLPEVLEWVKWENVEDF